jgi:hypothetical protein
MPKKLKAALALIAETAFERDIGFGPNSGSRRVEGCSVSAKKCLPI